MLSNIYAMYLRKSREDIEAESRGAEDTLKRHRLELVELAIRMKINISEEDIYSEVVTADTIADRPEVLRLLAAVGAGKYRGVLVMDVDRLARGDTADQGIMTQTFLAHRTLIVTPYRTYDPDNDSDREFFEFKLFMARAEYRAIVRRMQTGRGTSTKEGKYAGSVDPYGYDRVPLPRGKGFTLRIREDQAQVVRMIFDWYVNGMDGHEPSFGEIARRLNRMGIPSPRGKQWHGDGISRLIRSELYRGNVTWAKRRMIKLPNRTTKHPQRVLNDKAIIARGLHPAIVDEALFEAAQRRASVNRPLSVRTDHVTATPFSGLIYCGECGYVMRARPGWGSNKASGFRCTTHGCPTSGASNDVLERAVLDILRGWISSESPAPVRKRDENPAISACTTLISQLEDQLARVYDSFERGLYDDETFLLRRSVLTVRLEDARAELKRLRGASQTPSLTTAIDPDRVRYVLEAYHQCATPEDKNQLLRTVISKIVYHKRKKASRAIDASDLLVLDVYPRFYPN